MGSKIARLQELDKKEALNYLTNKLNTNTAEIERKLHTLKTQPNQQLEKIKVMKSGTGGDEVYAFNWP